MNLPTWFFPLLDLVSWLAGGAGTLTLALSVGDPSPKAGLPMAAIGHDKRGNVRTYAVAFVLSQRGWRRGIRLIIFALLLQLPKVLQNFLHAVRP